MAAMFSFATLLTLIINTLLVMSPVTAAYTQVAADYTPANFFDGFDFFTGSDPTNGFVHAQSQGIIRNDRDSVYIGVDYWSYTSTGRQSVRLESKQRFMRGLFVLEMQHMPGSICGTWPAFWTLGDNWPNNGEIDIIEGVHKNVQNHMSLHTKAGCAINGQPEGSAGRMLSSNCDTYAPNQASNQGCSIVDNRDNSYGDGFNNNSGGGVYAMEWTEVAIKVWFWPRSQAPADVWGNPEPVNWGAPAGQFSGDCTINNFFKDHRIIFDITFCGDWAGNVWNDAGCNNLASTCIDHVSGQPAAFANTYWRIKSLKVWSS
ncbi:concanavalin A-like lectin/glucanase domain-containing protein [Terfezia claveryi]|nr:concanavalin A-like lectin/glucanase domain-containing protein [Terfezia claveryi]